MAEIKASTQINANMQKVWGIVSDLDRESKFWGNVTKVRTLARDGNTVKYESTIGKDDRCLQVVTMYPQEKIEAEYIKGIIAGMKTTTLNPNSQGVNLEIAWDIKFKGMAGFMSGKLINDFQGLTEQAVLGIKHAAEGTLQDSSFKMETRTHWADKFD